MKLRRGVWVWVTIVTFCTGSLGMIGGCTRPLFRPHRVSFQDEAGSTHLAVLSVAPWDKYVEAIQPKFDLTSKEAVDMVVPTTRGFEEKTLDALRVALKLAPPQSFSQTNDAGAVVDQQKPGDVSAIKDESSPAGDRKAADLPPKQSVLEQKIEVDPMLRYWAATALYQEVQLLNRYVKDAAIRDGFVPYVVRLQIATLPNARNEPYDAYANVSFFSGEETPLVPLDVKTRSAQDFQKMPQIIPLMVTDNLEATLHSRSVDQLRQYALGLLFLIQGFGGQVNVNRFTEELQAVLGRDLNSLLTVTRVTDNTLRIRLGALQQVGANYAMVPRTHNITLLLMVPDIYVDHSENRRITLVSRTTMLDAENGVTLEERSDEAIDAQLKAAGKRLCPGKDISTTDLRNLVGSVHKNDYVQFLSDLKASCSPEALWSALTAIIVGGRYASASFDLPKTVKVIPQWFPNQTALALDDKEEKTVVTLRGGKNLRTDKLSAALVVQGKANPPCFVSQEVVLTEGGKDGRWTFPSLAFWKLKDEVEKDGIALCVNYGPDPLVCGAPSFCQGKDTLLYGARYAAQAAPKEKDPGFLLKTGAKVVKADDNGKGGLDITIQKKSQATVTKVLVSVRGANVEKVMQGEKTLLAGPDVSFEVPVGTVKLQLSNLSPHVPLQVAAKNPDGTDAPSLELIVVGPRK